MSDLLQRLATLAKRHPELAPDLRAVHAELQRQAAGRQAAGPTRRLMLTRGRDSWAVSFFVRLYLKPDEMYDVNGLAKFADSYNRQVVKVLDAVKTLPGYAPPDSLKLHHIGADGSTVYVQASFAFARVAGHLTEDAIKNALRGVAGTGLEVRVV